VKRFGDDSSDSSYSNKSEPVHSVDPAFGNEKDKKSGKGSFFVDKLDQVSLDSNAVFSEYSVAEQYHRTVEKRNLEKKHKAKLLMNEGFEDHEYELI